VTETVSDEGMAAWEGVVTVWDEVIEIWEYFVNDEGTSWSCCGWQLMVIG